MGLRSVAVIVALAVSACGGPDRPSGYFHPMAVDSALSAAMRRGAGARVSIDSLGPEQWDLLYLFGPYMSVDAMRRCMRESHGFETYGIDKRDDIYVLIFVSPKGVISSTAQPRRDVRFSDDALARVYPRGSARFVVRRSTNGPLELAPADTTAPRCT